MKRFGLVMPDNLYYDFMRLFPDYGKRTEMLRRCVHRLVERAKVNSNLGWNGEVDYIADELYNKEAGERK